MDAEQVRNLIATSQHTDETLLGTHTSRLGVERNLGLPDAKRSAHMLTLGPTDVGKTQQMIHGALQDAVKGRGFCMVIPKGGAINQVLDKMPDERLDDVVYINPGAEHVTPVNVLEPHGTDQMNRAQKETQKEIIVSDITDVFRRFTENWGDRWGRILETLLRAHLDLNIYHGEQNTLIDVYNCVVDDSALTELIERTDEHVTRQQLLRVKEDMGTYELEPLQRRLNDFMTPTVRAVIGAPESGVDFREAIDENKIILVDIQKGEIGDAVANIIGSIVITKIWAAAQSRITLAPEDRDLYCLYVDELQNFAGEGSNFKKILAEAREYGLGCWLATQYLSNLESREMKAAVMSNCRTKIVYSPEGDDEISMIEAQLNGITRNDLARLGNYRCAVQIPGDITNRPAVIVDTYPPYPGEDRDLALLKRRQSFPTQQVPDTRIRGQTGTGQSVTAGGEDHDALLLAAQSFYEDRGATVRLLYQEEGEDKPDGTIITTKGVAHLEAENSTVEEPMRVLTNLSTSQRRLVRMSAC